LQVKFDRKKWFYGLMVAVLGLLLFGMSSLATPGAALAAEPGSPDSLEITGDGVTTPLILTREQLQAMEQYQHLYSAINTWPTKKWYVGKGVKLRDLLEKAGMTEEAKLLKFTSSDGYTVNLTVRELLEDKRYYFPGLKGKNLNDGDGHIPGSSEGAVEVEPILALVSVEGSDNPEYMNELNSLLLMLGQRAVTEQNGNLFSKYVNKIEVLTTEPEKWDSPKANPDSGKVSPGAMIALSNANMDDDKIHYTTDGSTPTLNSPIYNWIAKRWWSARGDVLGTINCPVGPINKTTTIKAITIGPGKYDSDVATFTYEVSGDISEVGDGTEAPGAEEQEKEEQKQEEPVTLNDITGHWALDSINTLVRQGCISGYPDGSFKPENTITRAEFAAVLVKAFQLENNNGKTFSDTAAHWAKDYIAAAAAKGLVSGYAGGNFGPDDLITREQMAVMIVKAAGLAPAAEAPGFADSPAISGWAVEAVAAATENGIMKGYSDNTIRPGGSATRAEAVTVIMNALNKMNTLNN